MHGINMAAPRLYDTFFTIKEAKEDVVLPLVGTNNGEAMNTPLIQPRAYICGEIPRVSENKTEMAGNAYFSGEFMKGFITQAEADVYFILKGLYSFGYLTICDPLEPEKVIVLHMEQAEKPRVSLDIQKNKADIEVSLVGVVYYSEADCNYADRVHELEAYIENVITKRCLNFLNERQKENIDVIGIERYANMSFLTEKDRENYHLDFKNLLFSVKTSVKINRTGNLSGVK